MNKKAKNSIICFGILLLLLIFILFNCISINDKQYNNYAINKEVPTSQPTEMSFDTEENTPKTLEYENTTSNNKTYLVKTKKSKRSKHKSYHKSHHNNNHNSSGNKSNIPKDKVLKYLLYTIGTIVAFIIIVAIVLMIIIKRKKNTKK